jgi:hypothetical protein
MLVCFRRCLSCRHVLSVIMIGRGFGVMVVTIPAALKSPRSLARRSFVSNSEGEMRRRPRDLLGNPKRLV